MRRCSCYPRLCHPSYVTAIAHRFKFSSYEVFFFFFLSTVTQKVGTICLVHYTSGMQGGTIGALPPHWNSGSFLPYKEFLISIGPVERKCEGGASAQFTWGTAERTWKEKSFLDTNFRFCEVINKQSYYTCLFSQVVCRKVYFRCDFMLYDR